MATLRYAHVHFKRQPAGVLRETVGGGSAFEYHDTFTGELACAMPRADRVHSWPQGLHPFFEHLGAEGWLRARLARTAELDVEDDLGLLLRFGRRCIGAVSIHDPEARHEATGGQELDPLGKAALEAKRTVSGVQPKLLVRRDGERFVPAGPDGSALYIAKFPTADLPNLVTNEALSLELARHLLGPERVVEAQRGFVEGINLAALVVRRFDRTADDAPLRLEDFAQILAVPRRRDYAGKYDAGYEDAADAIRRHGARPRIDLLRYLERVTVSFLLGDCDAHLKNFSLLECPEGLRLSPAYDIVNTCAFARYGFSIRFGLRLGGRARQWDDLDRADFVALGAALGLPEKATTRALNGLVAERDAVLRRIRPRAARSEDDWRHTYWSVVDDAFARLSA